MANWYKIAKSSKIIAYDILTIPHILMINMSPAHEIINCDVNRFISEWCDVNCSWRKNTKIRFLLFKYPEFRNLLYYRIEMSSHLPSRLILVVARWLLKPINTLFFYTPKIGAGLFIQHGFSTVIAANSIGDNCWINQQVTIGYSNKTDCPTIGNNVRIAAGAKVFGKITIGDNTIIGANAVVCKDVPASCTVVGVPAYIVRREGRRVHESL